MTDIYKQYEVADAIYLIMEVKKQCDSGAISVSRLTVTAASIFRFQGRCASTRKIDFVAADYERKTQWKLPTTVSTAVKCWKRYLTSHTTMIPNGSLNFEILLVECSNILT